MPESWLKKRRLFCVTAVSSSILVTRVGTDSARILRDKLEALVPVFSVWLVKRMETELNAKAAEFLRSQIAAWASANPDSKVIIGAIRPQVGNIRVRPIRFITNNGHHILVLSTNSELGLSID